MEIPQGHHRIYVEGHGCSASLADTEMIRGTIERGGYELTDDVDAADLSVLVTCSVKSVTEQRMLSRIRDLHGQGKKKLIVAGCLPKASASRIMMVDPELSMIGPESIDKIIPTIESTLVGRQSISIESRKLVKLGLPRSRLNEVTGIIEISSGCVSNCTFCQVKLVKGVVFSYPEDRIINEAKLLLSKGVRELWLTSTDNAAYGRDTKTSLPNLIRRITAIPGNFKVRIGMMNPLLTRNMLDDLVDCFENEKVFKFIHLPVQSGSSRILGEMRRGYTVNDFYRTVSAFRSSIPRITLSTDLIVGFPSETEKEFDESQDLIRRVRPDVVNISRYGAREGTKAASMEGQIDAAVSKDRSGRMTSLVKQIQKEVNSRWIGWTCIVLVDEVVKNAFVGRNYAYKPCLITKERGESFEGLLGKELTVKIVGATSSTLRTQVVRQSTN